MLGERRSERPSGPTLLTTSRAGAGGWDSAAGTAGGGGLVGADVGTMVATGAGVGAGVDSAERLRVDVSTTAAKMPRPTTIGSRTVETISVCRPAWPSRNGATER